MNAFHEGALPLNEAVGASGAIVRRTDIVTLASGAERRNAPWAHGRRSHDLAGAVSTLDDIAAVLAFFEARRGRLQAFRFRDPADCSSCAPSATPSPFDQVIGAGDGAQLAFQLVRTYGSGADAYVRPIRKPVAGSVRIAVAGIELTAAEFGVDATTGAVTLSAAPAAGELVTAGYLFDTPVRFDADRLERRMEGFGTGRFASIPLVEAPL
jgi:uncharacterized protein (TIGR02217 family)